MANTFPTLTGTNLTGGEWEWDATYTPVDGSNYMFVSNADIDYVAAKGFNFGRLVFSWELMQPALNGPLSTVGYGPKMKSRVDYITGKGMYVLVEPHGASDVNFIRYKGNLVGSTAVPNSAFADFWSKMALLYKDNPRVAFGLGNEPHDMSTMQWYSAAQAAITAIRATGATNMIFVDGNGWSAPSTWNDSSIDTATTKVSNAVGWLTLNDPLKNTVVSVHTYFDANGGGGADDVAGPDIIAQRMQPVVDWARAHGLKVHLSEFGANSATSGAQTAVTNACTYLKNNSDVVIGWSWWAYGPPAWWGGYRFTLCPTNNYTTDNPKISWLKPFMAPLQVPAPTPTPTPTGTVPSNPVSFTKNTVFTLTTPQSNYWVYVPGSYDSTHATPMKMFVWLHGCGGQSQYDVSMVSPGGTAQNWISIAVGGREGACWSNMATDGPKILAAIADMKTHFNIDPNQVFLGGYSSGGDIGYPLLFTNANLFAGGLFENTGPDSSALTAANTAAWKVNIAHLAHTSDTTYPIATVRTNMTTLQGKGFPVTLIEKPGTHYDSGATYDTPGSTPGDLRAYLLPFLNAGWTMGGAVAPPPQPPPPSPTAVPNIVLTTTTLKAPGDQGFTSSKVVGTGMDVPAGTYTISVATRTSYSDQTSFTANLFFTNPYTNVDLSWEELKMDLRGHTIVSIWNAEVASTDPVTGYVTIRPVGGTNLIHSQGKNGFGMYLKRTSNTATAHYQVLVKSLKW